MNREIKFRAWDKENEQMIYDGTCDKWEDAYESGRTYLSLDFDGKLSGYVNDDGGKTGLWEHNVEINRDRFILMQFTGLKDKNGKEIWEGDICKETCEHIINNGPSEDGWAPFVLPIKFHDGMFAFGYHTNELSYFIRNWGLKVIGNVHENPELLK